MKAAIIGAGSTYTPELIEGFCERLEQMPFECIALMDIDEAALDLVGGLAKRQLREGGFKGEVILTGDLGRALDGAAFVFAQVRPGRMAGRILDEKLPLKYGLLGQETTGAGGFMQALRTVPVVMNIAEQMKRLSEGGAWLINFSNPSGIIAEAVLNLTDINMIGLCNCPINMIKGIRDALSITDASGRTGRAGSSTDLNAFSPGDCGFDYEYVGLNHLSWITSVVRHGETENIAASLAGVADTSMKNNPAANLDKALLRAVPYIPSSYLNYYYMRGEQVQKCLDAEKCRGEICVEIEGKLREQYADPNLKVKPPELAQRGGALYSTAALSAAEAIVCDKHEKHVVAARNNASVTRASEPQSPEGPEGIACQARNDKAVPFMDDSDVVEVLCELSRSGVKPQPVTVYNEYVIGLMRAVKAYEKLTVRAAMEGDRDIALAAMMAHPLIGDIAKALPLLEDMLKANKEHLPNFFKG